MTDEAGRRSRRPFYQPPAPLWVRPDAHRWIRPDADHFMPPGWRDEEPYASLALYDGRERESVAKSPASPQQVRVFTEAERRQLLQMLDDYRVIAAELRAMREALEDKAGFNPSQPRVPAGYPEGGQWTDAGDEGTVPMLRPVRRVDASGALGSVVMSDASPDPIVPGAQYAALRSPPRDRADGHHYVHQSLYDKLPLSSETRKVFEEAKTGRLYDPRNNKYDRPHREYNEAVRDLFESFMAEKN